MTKFNGLIQHSFALRLADAHQPFDGHSTQETLAERFGALADGGRRFSVVALKGGGKVDEDDPSAAHTLLARTDLTTVRPVPVGVLGDEANGADCNVLPPAFLWAGPGRKVDAADKRCDNRSVHPQMIFAQFEEEYERTSRNDFLVKVAGQDVEGEPSEKVARSLLEAVAFRRSQLFGLAISNRFVNVMLPCATLTPSDGRGNAGKRLLLLALVCLMRDGGDRRAFRRMYSLTLYALPVKPGEELREREMDSCEIESVVNAGWGLADAIPQKAVPRYEMGGPLWEYVGCLARPGATALLRRAEAEAGLSFRMVTELVAYGVALRMAQGSRGEALKATKRRIGNDVVTTLSTARVSAALLVDPNLKRKKIRKPIRWRDPPGSLVPLMKTLAGDTRLPEWTPATRGKYTLDRPFVDSEEHAVGLLPRNRCLLVAYLPEQHRKDPVPLLSLVAGVTFMTGGTATAIGTLRSIDRDLERLEHGDPRKIAEIDGEVATDLHEVYDLDIANEAYRSLYRRLCDRLRITQDYKTLQDKMQTLYRATSTFHNDREQKQLAWLTAAIVALSVLILIVTIAGASK